MLPAAVAITIAGDAQDSGPPVAKHSSREEPPQVFYALRQSAVLETHGMVASEIDLSSWTRKK
jgi:hypothetical protein